MRKLALGLLGVVLGSAWFLLWLLDETGQRRRALARVRDDYKSSHDYSARFYG